MNLQNYAIIASQCTTINIRILESKILKSFLKGGIFVSEDLKKNSDGADGGPRSSSTHAWRGRMFPPMKPAEFFRHVFLQSHLQNPSCSLSGRKWRASEEKRKKKRQAGAELCQGHAKFD